MQHRYENINAITPMITIYSASVMPWFLIFCQLILVAVYLENRSWKYGHLSPTEKYYEHIENNRHCECNPPSSDPYLQKHTSAPLMSGFEMWEGFIYGCPTLIFFTYFALKLSSYQHKFRQNTQRILARLNVNVSQGVDSDTFLHLQQEKEANQQLISRILWFIITPLLICVKLSFGLTNQINWYVVFSPWLVLCIVYMTEGYQHGVWWFREQAEVNQMLNEVNANIVLEEGRNRNLNEEELSQLQDRLNDTLYSYNINDDDDNTNNNNRSKKLNDKEEELEKKRKEEELQLKKTEDEKLQRLNLLHDSDF
jgi:hypothetical protein